jgi:hypothetical protein
VLLAKKVDEQIILKRLNCAFQQRISRFSEKNFIIPSSSINKCLGLRLILFADVVINLKIIALRINTDQSCHL